MDETLEKANKMVFSHLRDRITDPLNRPDYWDTIWNQTSIPEALVYLGILVAVGFYTGVLEL